MAFLRKYIDKPTFLMLVGAWNAVSGYILTSDCLGNPLLEATIITVGNLVIGWFGVESGQGQKDLVER